VDFDIIQISAQYNVIRTPRATFYRAMHFSAKRGIAITCCPSDGLSVRLSDGPSVCNVQVA